MAAPQQTVLDLVRCFRRQWSLVCDCERSTVCSADDMLLVLQLAVAEVNKTNGSGYTASLSDVLLTWKHLLKDKLGMTSDGCPSPQNYDSIRKTYDQLLKNSSSLDLIDLYAAFSKPGSSGTSISSDQLQEFLFGHQSEGAGHSSLPALTPCKNNMDFVKIKGTVKRIFCSYLSLLVNAKNDIALAQVINCPERGLGRKAFTDLKHEAKNKQMSLFLAATSFIRVVELGGKGYAPSEADPLRKHIKGLSLFVHFIDRLQEILGETHTTRNAVELILSAIKMHLIKGRGNGDSFSEAVIEVAQDLDLRMKSLLNLSNESEFSTGISPARPRIHAINRGTALCGRETIKTLLILLDEEAACPPSKNKAELLCADEENTIFGAVSLLSLFRSPEQSNGSSPKPLNQRLQNCMDKNKPQLKQNLIRSQFSCTYKDVATTQSKPSAFPSMSQVPTCIHPAPKIVPVLSFDDDDDVPIGNGSKEKTALQIISGNEELKCGKAKSSKDSIRKSTKRKQLDNCENHNIPDDEPPQKKTLPPTKPKEKATTARKNSKSAAKKQIVGQAKLTSFFRV